MHLFTPSYQVRVADDTRKVFVLFGVEAVDKGAPPDKMIVMSDKMIVMSAAEARKLAAELLESADSVEKAKE